MVAKSNIIDTSKWLTPKQVMALLQYRRVSSITAMCINGTFRHLNRGTDDKPSYLIDPDSIAEWQRKRIAGGSKKEPTPPAAQYPPGVKKFV